MRNLVLFLGCLLTTHCIFSEELYIVGGDSNSNAFLQITDKNGNPTSAEIILSATAMKKAAGEWCININMNKLMLVVLQEIIRKQTALTGDELRYIRTYLEMTSTEFGKTFGVSHVAVLKWEGEQNRISLPLELCIRLYVLNHLDAKDKEFRALYNDIDLQQLSKGPKGKLQYIAVDASRKELKIA